ncbi:rod shape-determining protein RodA [soil metagenome]
MIGIAAAATGTPRGPAKLLALHWPLVILITAVAAMGILMLYSAAGGAMEPWASRQLLRFGLGMAGLFAVAMIHVRVWQASAPLAYAGAFGLLVLVEAIGTVGMGAQRWIALGPLVLQPSEIMKIALVLALATYYAWLPADKVSRPLAILPPLLLILAPTALVLTQPDLGTAVLLLLGGGAVMFIAGVSIWYFLAAIGGAAGLGALVMRSEGSEWQLLKDYQFRRIHTFLDPATDPLGAGYHITQATIAMGSGGMSGRGFMQGTQSRLNFLPENHTDFIFTTLAEEFGLVGSGALLALYALIVAFCIAASIANRDRFGALLTAGIGVTFFLYFAVNMAMVMGLIPVVGVPLPLVSYGGSAMLVLLAAFGLVQSAHIHRPRLRS